MCIRDRPRTASDKCGGLLVMTMTVSVKGGGLLVRTMTVSDTQLGFWWGPRQCQTIGEVGFWRGPCRVLDN